MTLGISESILNSSELNNKMIKDSYLIEPNNKQEIIGQFLTVGYLY